ncbi:MAG: ABC transporter permease [Candidatus Ryanbacteria bacterium RIFCSPHIGHO2_02_FULL_48_12]|uniref:Transport permease protein n=1 Tax=Candidatus Ryanbacteria bacterium RIFCSPHIGHO2_01_FULL_48_27 TaxID=1802115 RepID=A0A1G2G588_9BACT|nr:MAG: ABC transporter permease [Candidatus Ryanbacteria bacterium RIFCSPHIGHO2_01_FULL_48_27]OGZ50406.1 MAG: ABC transporter permease [Candidatus Ryanbacteria bacterium RIFCSPHIGHO2_02_FULL_48_12]
MESRKIFIAFSTMVRNEVSRFLRIWMQTLIPPVITTVLYYVIFGSFIGSQIAPIHGFSYMQFIVPGLVMMAVITSSFSNVVGSFYFSKFQRSIEELLVSPMPFWVLIAGYITGGVVRGLLVGTITLLVSLFFTHLVVSNIFFVLSFILLTAILFSLAGLLNGLYAKNFDGISIFPTFVLTPLTYLGGIFYSIAALPPFWQSMSKLNPILYMINGFRYGFLGFSDVSVAVSFWILVVCISVLFGINWHLFRKGYGLRS